MIRMGSPVELSLSQAREALAARDLCPVDYVQSLLRHIEEHDTAIGAFIYIDADRAIAEAERRRDDWHRDGLPPLYGIPFAVKDIIDVAGTPTTCQSRAASGEPARRTATCIELLQNAGGVFMGKLALYEFALGGPSFDEPWPPVRNPWNLDYTPGSSSSGCGAALAARMIPLAIGTDTGGSIRSPAMMNGVVGLKPSFGRISTDGLFPLAPSMDTVGPMARTVRDVAIAFDSLVPSNHKDRIAPIDHPARLGSIDHLWRTDLCPSEDVVSAIDEAFADLRRAGAEIVPRHLAPLETINAAGWTILYAEAFHVHRDGLLTHPELYGTPVRDMLLTGAFFSADDYLQATELRQELGTQLDRALEGLDCLVTAVSALPPCRLDDVGALEALAAASVRVICNVTGHPGLAVPVGFSDEGLPIGVQLIGHKGHDRALLSVGQWIETSMTSWTVGGETPALIHSPSPACPNHDRQSTPAPPQGAMRHRAEHDS